MAIAHEDTVLGGANISGDPTPVSPRSLPNQRADLSRQINHRPTPASKQAGAQQAMKGAPKEDKKKSDSPAGKPDSNRQSASEAQSQDTPAPPLPQGNPILPIDWKAKQAADPWTVHQHGQYVSNVLSSLLLPGRPSPEQQAYLGGVASATGGASLPAQALQNLGAVYNAAADPNAIGQSVKNIWDQNTAAGTVAKWVVDYGGPATAIPQLDMALRGVNEKQAVADTVGQALPMTANPLNAMAPESRAAQLALYGTPAILQALNASPHDRANAMTWAAITGALLSAGHLSAFKGVLSDALAKWPELEDALYNVMNGRKEMQTKIQDPTVDHRLDWIAESLKNPGFPGSVTRVPGAGAAEVKDIIERRPFGNVPGQFRDVNVTAERVKKALQSVDAGSRSELESQIAAGRKSVAEADALAKNWTEMGFKYDLNVVTRPDSPLRDPLAVLKAAPPDVRARGMRALTAANGYLTQMKSGLAVNRRSSSTELTSLWRSLTGHARGTDATDREGVAAMLDLAGHVDGNLLSKAIEGDKAVYDGLPHDGKAYVDIWRLLSNEERLARQQAGIEGAVGDRVWRVPKRLPNAVRGAGGGGVLATQAERSRALAPTVQSELPKDPAHRAIPPTTSPGAIASDLNSRALFHGSPDQGIPESSLSLGPSNPSSLMGPGLYMTDHPSIASSYTKKAVAGAVYKASTNFKSVLHAEAPLNPEIRQNLLDELSKDYFGNQVIDQLKADIPANANYLDFVRVVKETFSELSHQDSIPAYEFQESMLTLNRTLREAGFDGVTHTGGIRGGPPHTVAVALDPGKELHDAPSGVSSWGDAAENRIVLTQAHDIVASANAAVARQRAGALGHLTDWATPLSKEFADKPEAQAIRTLARTDIPAAEKRARDYVNGIYRDFETDSHRILARGGFGQQIKSLHSMQAVKELEGMTLKVANPAVKGAEMMVKAAVRVSGMDPREVALLRDAGYRPMDQGHFNDVLVNKQFADLLDKGRAHGAQPRGKALEAALQTEGLALKLIMYNPAVHGWNVASRMLSHAGMQALTDPVGLMSHALGGGNSEAMRQEAINAGVQTHGKYANFLPDVYKQLADATGEHDLFQLPVESEAVTGHSAEVADLAGLGRPKLNFYQKAQNLLWTMVDDFAVSAYHIEKHSAMAWPASMNAAEASAHAARRANSWAGYVAAEDTNPLIHDGARLVMFAPAFWRTWGELFVPLYKDSGVGGRQQALQMAKQEIPLIAATIATAYVSGNMLNLIASGQFQDHNEPQNRWKVEVRRPEFIRALQAAHYPGADKIDPTTGYGPNGEVLSLDNPLGRFQKDVATAAGLNSGHTDYQFSDTEDGLAQFATNRLSPFISGAMALGNLDLYRSVKDWQARAVDQTESVGHPTPTSVLSSLLYMTPNGSNLVRQITSNQSKASDLELPGGAKVPAGVVRVASAFGNTTASLLWQAMTGTTGPYTTSERTRGQAPSDDEYRKYAAVKTTYESQMAALDAEVAGGSITPSQWLQGYQRDHTAYAAQAGAFFNHAPEQAYGPVALTASWEATYAKATLPDGSLEPSKLAALQAEWQAKHTPADMAAVKNELAKSDRKYPMLGLYHKTIAAYSKWQETWASQHGYDVNTIRAEAREYGAAYGDRVKSTAVLRAHRDLALYERAKKTEFEHTSPGLLYSLFYGSPAAAVYMRARDLTTAEVEAEVQAQP